MAISLFWFVSNSTCPLTEIPLALRLYLWVGWHSLWRPLVSTWYSKKSGSTYSWYTFVTSMLAVEPAGLALVLFIEIILVATMNKIDALAPSIPSWSHPNGSTLDILLWLVHSGIDSTPTPMLLSSYILPLYFIICDGINFSIETLYIVSVHQRCSSWVVFSRLLYWYDQLFAPCDVWPLEGLDNSSESGGTCDISQISSSPFGRCSLQDFL